MKTLLLTTGQGKSTLIRRYLRDSFAGWQVETALLDTLDKINSTPELTLVQLDSETEPSDVKAMVPHLATLQTRSPHASIVMLGMERESRIQTSGSKEQEDHFLLLFNQIRNRLQEFPDPDRVDFAFWHGGAELAARLMLIEAKAKVSRPRPSQLDRVKEIVDATSDLRVDNGKLSAEAVAKAFGVSASELADWFGRSRQAVFKTPDADSLQNKLSFFERVARLRTVISNRDFLKWLRMPNRELDGKHPLDLLAEGEGQVVADLVDDMLTGAPA